MMLCKQTARQTGKPKGHQCRFTAREVRGAERLEKISMQGQTRASQHRAEGERSGEWRWLTFHPVRFGPICINQTNITTVSSTTCGKLVREGAESGMDVSECGQAILRWNWNWSELKLRIWLRVKWISNVDHFICYKRSFSSFFFT